MDCKLELVAIPVSDVSRAKAFYTDQVGFHADHDHQINDELRFVQLTPVGTARRGACVRCGSCGPL
jgi:catechol 2,3-dioxygenase-like lactoylglutathione lyase family enzyme